jgi:hypothetical protein
MDKDNYTTGTTNIVRTSARNTILSKARSAYKRKGVYYVFQLGFKMALQWPKNSIWFWYHRNFKSPETFEFQGKTYQYLYHPYCASWTNERAVNIPIVWEIVKKYKEQGKRILEVGNFLSYVYPVNHDILDKYEKLKGIINEDVVDFNPSTRYDLIISILTLQCVGWDETPRDREKILRAIDNLKGLLARGGQMIVTIGLGYNTELDKLLSTGRLRFDRQYYLKRFPNLKWKEVDWEDVKNLNYDESVPTSTGIVIGFYNNNQ